MRRIRRCKACGRRLRSMESVIDGYGPVCYKALFGEKEKTSKPEVNGLEVYAHYECEGQISLFEYLEEKEQGSSEE